MLASRHCHAHSACATMPGDASHTRFGRLQPNHEHEREDIMIRLCSLAVALASLLAAVISGGTAVAQSAKDLAGTYTLVSAITEKDGAKSDTFGPNAKGILTLD